MHDHFKTNWKQKFVFTRLRCFFAHISRNSDIFHRFVPALFTIQLPLPSLLLHKHFVFIRNYCFMLDYVRFLFRFCLFIARREWPSTDELAARFVCFKIARLVAASQISREFWRKPILVAHAFRLPPSRVPLLVPYTIQSASDLNAKWRCARMWKVLICEQHISSRTRAHSTRTLKYISNCLNVEHTLRFRPNIMAESNPNKQQVSFRYLYRRLIF